MKVDVTLLDGSTTTYDVDPKSSGEDLLEKVATSLNLVEKDYFGFLYLDKRDKIWTWLHNDRKIQKQLSQDHRVLFQVRKLN